MKKGNNAISLIMKGRQSIQAIKKGLITVYEYKGNIPLLDEKNNLILNSILATDTPTELDITYAEINEILDEIIGG
jgi:hypothetical protein